MSQEYTKPGDNSILEKAREWRAAGFQVLPVSEDGMKRPDSLKPTPTTDPNAPRDPWKPHKKKLIDAAVIESVFSAGRTGLGAMTGVGFRKDGLKLFMIEADEPDLRELIRDTAEAADESDVLALVNGLVEETPGGGVHMYALCPVVPKNEKLARTPAPTPENPRAVEVRIETRGSDGFVVMAPSHGAVHPSGKPYRILRGTLQDIPKFTNEQIERILKFLRMFDEMPKLEAKPSARVQTINGDRPGDLYNKASTLDTVIGLLNGTLVYDGPKFALIRREGKDRGTSFTYWKDTGLTYVFTTSTILDSERAYSPFSLYAHFQHGGDFAAAAKALYAEGYGKRPQPKLILGKSGDSSDDAGDDSSDNPRDETEDEATADDDGIPAIALNNTLRFGGNVFWYEDDKGLSRLTNGAAWITHYVSEQIGPGEIRQSYRMAGMLANGTKLPSIDIPVEELGDLQRWPARGGPLWARFTLEPGFTVRDRVRAAIQLYSQHLGFEAVSQFSETGWCVVDGLHVYRAHGMAIGAEGIRTDVDVRLGSDFERYSFPEVPDAPEIASLGRQWLRLFDVAPDDVMATLLPAPPRAILNEFLPADSLIYAYGPTGAYKTELTVLIQTHFGKSFTSRTLPLNFEGTSNSIQAATWRMKDTVVVIDDMAPGGNRYQQDATFAKLGAIARSVGNRAGRTRSNADMSAKMTFSPRGLVIASGEDTARGHSETARIQAIEIPYGVVRTDVLTECQALAAEGVFAKLTAGFIREIAASWDATAAGIKTAYERELSLARSMVFTHRRTADAIAPQMVAAIGWFEYLQRNGAISIAERDRYLARIRAGLIAVGEAQSVILQDTNPVEVFIENLRSAVLSGGAHIADKFASDCPSQASRFGWRTEMRRVGDHLEPFTSPRGTTIGWVDLESDAVYLDPVSAYAAAQQIGNLSGRTVPTTVTTLGKRLLDSKHIQSTESGRVKTKVYVMGAARRVWHLKASDIFPAPELEASDREPTPFARTEVA